VGKVRIEFKSLNCGFGSSYCLKNLTKILLRVSALRYTEIPDGLNYALNLFLIRTDFFLNFGKTEKFEKNARFKIIS
jgi:hypothetical protein